MIFQLNIVIDLWMIAGTRLCIIICGTLTFFLKNSSIHTKFIHHCLIKILLWLQVCKNESLNLGPLLDVSGWYRLPLVVIITTPVAKSIFLSAMSLPRTSKDLNFLSFFFSLHYPKILTKTLISTKYYSSQRIPFEKILPKNSSQKSLLKNSQKNFPKTSQKNLKNF